MRFVLFDLMVIVGLAFPPLACAKTTSEPAPLFPVAMEHEFPNPRPTFEEVHNLILERYYSPTIDSSSLYHAAIKGMLAHISPPDNRDLAKLWSMSQYQRLSSEIHRRHLTRPAWSLLASARDQPGYHGDDER